MQVKDHGLALGSVSSARLCSFTDGSAAQLIDYGRSTHAEILVAGIRRFPYGRSGSNQSEIVQEVQ